MEKGPQTSSLFVSASFFFTLLAATFFGIHGNLTFPDDCILEIASYRYELYTNKDETGYIPMTLPASEFKDFAHEGPVTWISFSELLCV